MSEIKTKILPNKKQQECIDTISGKVMVLAGPGTGKTFTVIERIKNMLEKEIDPAKILCLTFSEAAAAEMKNRLIAKIGQKAAPVNIYTYHGFCWEIIQSNEEYFEEYSSSQVINDTAKRNLMHLCIDELDTKYFKTSSGDKFYHLNKILSRVNEVKKNLLTKEEYFYNLENHPQWGRGLKEIKENINDTLKQGKKITQKLENTMLELEKKINQARELYSFYELYNQKMKENNYIDFNDMIILVLNKFVESANFLDKISNN